MDGRMRLLGLSVVIALLGAGIWYAIERTGAPTLRGHHSSGDTRKAAPVESADETGMGASSPSVGVGLNRVVIAKSVRTSPPAVAVPGLEKTGYGMIDGMVRWSEGKEPAAHARVVVERVDTSNPYVFQHVVARAEITADAQGAYQVRDLTAGSYQVMAWVDNGFGLGHAQFANGEKAERMVDIALRPVGAISGRVRTENGAAVAGATVLPGVGRKNGKDVYADVGSALQAMTDRHGAFTLPNLPDAQWRLVVIAKGYAVQQSKPTAVGVDNAEIVVHRGGSVSGHVVDAATKAPQPNVRVLLVPRQIPENRHWRRTDASGAFTFDGLADDVYGVLPRNPGLVVIGPRTECTIQGANRVSGLEIRVTAGGTVSGRVLDADTRKPMPGISILAMARDGQDRGSRNAVADSDGVYRIEGLASGTYSVTPYDGPNPRFVKQGRETKTVEVELGRDSGGVDFLLKPGLHLRGRVTDETGKPLRGAEVSANDPVNFGWEAQTRTRSDGSFDLEGIARSRTTMIEVRKEEYVPAQAQLTFRNVDINDRSFRLKKGASISGVVVETSGHALPGGLVLATRGGKHRPDGVGLTGDRGQFKISGLPAGEYTMNIEIDPKGSYIGPEPPRTDVGSVTVSAGQALTGVRLVYQPGYDDSFTIEGRVTNEQGKPLEGASVCATTRDGGPGYAQAKSNVDGHFVLARLRQCEYELGIGHIGYSAISGMVVRGGTRNLSVVLARTGALEGHVIDAHTGQPVTSFQAAVAPSNPDGLQRWLSAAPGYYGQFAPFVDPGGAFHIEVSTAGNAVLLVRSLGYAPGGTVVENVRAGQTVTGLKVRLEVAAVINGTVTDEEGNPVAGATVYLNPVPPSVTSVPLPGGSVGNARTDASGTFRITDAPTRLITVNAMHVGYTTGKIQLTPVANRANTVTLVLKRVSP